MRLIKPSFELWDQTPSEIGIYKQIERAGRVCYKSEDRLTEDSYKKFVEMLKSHAHGAMLEHGTVYLKIPTSAIDNGDVEIDTLVENPYTKLFMGLGNWYFTTNYRVIVENGLEKWLKYICEPTEFHEKRVTVHFVTDRGVSHEFVRHRTMSFAQESTRYCNYSKDKFGNELTFIIPSWIDLEEGSWGVGHGFMNGFFYHKLNDDNFIYPDTEQKEDVLDFLQSLKSSEKKYLKLIKRGRTPQQARQVLPNATKTELIMTGFVSDWEHFFELRCAKDAHPDARALAIPLREEFVKRGYIQ